MTATADRGAFRRDWWNDPWRALGAWALVQAVLSYLRRSTLRHDYVADGLARLWAAPLPDAWAPVLRAVCALWWIAATALAIRWGRTWVAGLREAWRADAREPREPSPDSADEIAFAALVATVAALAVYAQAHRFSINWDCAYLLRSGQVVAEGGLPFRDFVDPNPPLIMYLMAVPAWLARVLGIHAFSGFNLFIIALAGASLAASRRFLKGAPEPLRSRRDWLLLPYALFHLALAYHGEFGQREHLFVLLATPAILCRWLRWEGATVSSTLAALAGFGAGIGVLIKPHFLLVPLALEAAWFLAYRRRVRAFAAPEVAAADLAAAAYAAWLAFGPEVLRDEYWGRWFPFYLRHYNDVFSGASRVWDIAPNLVVPAVLAVVVARKSPGPAARLGLGLFSGAVGAFAVFVVQKKGFSYHAVPYAAMLMLSAGVTLAVEARRFAVWKSAAPVSPRVAALLVAAAIVAWPVLPDAWPTRRRLAHENERREVIERLTRPGDPILVLSPTLMYAFPLAMMMERRPVTRFSNLLMLGGFYGAVRAEPGAPFPYHTPQTASEEERRFLADLSADVARDRPKIVMIEHRAWCQGCPPGFDVHDFFRASGFIESALSEYRLVGAIPEFVVYALPEAIAAARD